MGFDKKKNKKKKVGLQELAEITEITQREMISYANAYT